MILPYFSEVSYFGQAFADDKKDSHYSYFSNNPQEDFGDTFYRNNEYMKCEAQNLCKERENVTELDPLRKYAFFFQRENDESIVPVFLQCYRDGSSTASMAESLVPLMNEAVLQDGEECVDENEVEAVANPAFVTDTLKAIQGYEGGCPKQEKGCFEQIGDGFLKDLKMFMNPSRFFYSEERVETGCLSNIVSNIGTAIVQTGALLFYHLPVGIWNSGVSAAKGLWNKFMGREEETSDGLLNASIMESELLQAVVSRDFAKAWTLLQKNFWSFWKGIKEYYINTIGCTEWDGVPYYSTCLKKMDWTCRNCGNMMNYACGLLAQFGTGYLLGGILGMSKGALAVKNASRAMALSATTKVATEVARKSQFATKATPASNSSWLTTTLADLSNKSKDVTARINFSANRKMKPVVDTLRTQRDEVKYFMGMGDSFRGLVASFPPTKPYHHIYQMGKDGGFDLAARTINRKVIGASPLQQGRALAFRFDTIKRKFDDKLFDELMKLRGTSARVLDEGLKEVYDEYFKIIQRNLNGTGAKTTIMPDGKSIRISMGDESFLYRPDFKRFLDKDAPPPRGLSQNKYQATLTHEPMEIKYKMANDDIFLSSAPLEVRNGKIPNFMKEMVSKAEPARRIHKIKPEGMDGYAFVTVFSAQMNGIPEREDCTGKLNGVKLISKPRDISDYPSEERKAELIAEKEAREKAQAEEKARLEAEEKAKAEAAEKAKAEEEAAAAKRDQERESTPDGPQ